MKTTFSSHSMHAHSGWFNGIAIIFGYLWVISGLDKIGSGVFVSGFHQFVLENYLGENTYAWYVTLVKDYILPHTTFFGYLVEWGEFAIGIALIGSALWLLFRDSAFAHFVLACASVGGAFLVLNIILAEGAFQLGIDTSIVYEEGVSIDMIVLLVSLLTAAANFIAFKRECRWLS